MFTNKKNDEVGEECLINPFKSSGTVKHSPPKVVRATTSFFQKRTSKGDHHEGEEIHIARLKLEEETAFVKLGNKLSAMNSVVSEAKNIHKTIRDNLMQAVALYQQLRENREAIALSGVVGDIPENKSIQQENKEVQTEHEIVPKSSQKRTASISPEKSKTNKKVRTQPEMENSAEKRATPWTLVNRRGNNKRAKPVAVKKPVKIKGESLTIQAGNSN